MGDHEIPTNVESKALRSLTSSSTLLLHFLKIASAKHKFGSGHDVTCLYQQVYLISKHANPFYHVIELVIGNRPQKNSTSEKKNMKCYHKITCQLFIIIIISPPHAIEYLRFSRG